MLVKLDVILVGIGVWLVCDCLISIRLYYNSKDENGKKVQNWKADHSIRVIRGLIGLYLIVIGALLWT